MQSLSKHASSVGALRALAILAVLAAVGGCGGSGLSACPDHQPCVHFVSNPNVGGNGTVDGGDAADLASPAAHDLGSTHASDLGAGGDLATAHANDLAPACVATGGDCTGHNDAICCSKYCIYATNTCK